ncbi:right-handed parallel beta-helix repeat-containing protein [Streptomyces bottropensis]|uniref:right-handed parallel beta-helix repeat-containing protein n=1 Tax=Streptomyces bottropensis TaxID=42235 RepID=UPI0036B6C6FA
MASTRFVHATKGTSSGRFDTPAKPARSVGAALKAAAAGDTVVILDTATYLEDELVIDKPLTLTSAFLQTHPQADPSDPAFDVRALPTLAPKSGAQHRVLRVSGTPGKPLGPVTLSGLRVTQGRAVHVPGGPDPALGAGGGIAVVDTDDVRIERCVVTGCQTQAAALPAWPEADRAALRKDLVDLVDTVVPPFVEMALNLMIEAANRLIRNLPVGIAPIPPFDRNIVKDMIGTEFDAHIPPGKGVNWLAGQAFGGGIATVWSSAVIRNCRIQGNRAQGRGSGLAVVGYGWPTVENCWIDRNHSGDRGRLDGGGIGAEISLPGKLPRDLSEIELVRFLRSKASAARAAMASVSIPSPLELLQFARWLLDPTQPPVITDNLRRLMLFLSNSYKDPELLFRELFYVFAATSLALGRWDAWNEDEIKTARTRSITVKKTTITHNECGDDGGGVYASVLSRVTVTECRIDGNSAPGMGGGVRLSMGSAGSFTGCTVDHNASGTRPGTQMSKARPASSIKVGPFTIDRPAKPSIPVATPGGGGISVRNADLALTTTRIGTTAGGPSGNITSDHPGGGLLVFADTEGDMAGFPDMWTAIQHEVFEVRKIRVTVDASCLITGNGSGFRTGPTPVAKPLFAKGGGVFILQGTFPDAPIPEVSLTNVTATVRGNIAQVQNYTSRVAPGLAIRTCHEICIQDLKARMEWTETNDTPLIKAGTLRWP